MFVAGFVLSFFLWLVCLALIVTFVVILLSVWVDLLPGLVVLVDVVRLTAGAD